MGKKIEYTGQTSTALHTERRHGRTRHYVCCHNCSHEFYVYPWSLAGSGKRCPGCKIMHISGLRTVREVESE